MSAVPERSARIVIVTASASGSSRSERLGRHLVSLLRRDYETVDIVDLRLLPAAPLLAANVADADIGAVVDQLDKADAVVFITPTYKGSYTGLLKTFIDLLPQYALRGKTVLPVATGGTIAHVQMLDHCLRPVLQTMWPRHIEQGCFVLDQTIKIDAEQKVELADDSLLLQVVEQFEAAIAAFATDRLNVVSAAA